MLKKYVALLFLTTQCAMQAADQNKIKVAAYEAEINYNNNPPSHTYGNYPSWGKSILPIYSEHLTTKKATTYGDVKNNIEATTHRFVIAMGRGPDPRNGIIHPVTMSDSTFEFKLNEDQEWQRNFPIYAVCKPVPQCIKQQQKL